MNPLQRTICEHLRPGLYDELVALGVYGVLREPPPCVSSIFLIGAGGSYDYQAHGHHIRVHNGTLQAVDDQTYDSLSERYAHALSR